MKIVSTINEVREQVKEWKKEGNTIGFVPTMGYLHEGHASLIDAARKNNGKVVVSIFVNPIQFGPNEDLDSYPRDLEHDAKLCEEHGVDLIFHPTPEGGKPVSDSPKTGDNTNLWLWFMLLGIGATGTGALAFMRKKKH